MEIITDEQNEIIQELMSAIHTYIPSALVDLYEMDQTKVENLVKDVAKELTGDEEHEYFKYIIMYITNPSSDETVRKIATFVSTSIENAMLATKANRNFLTGLISILQNQFSEN